MDHGHGGHGHEDDEGGGRARLFALGCATLVLALTLACVFSSMYLSSQVRDSEPYRGAVVRAAKDKRVQKLLGEDFEDGLQRVVSGASESGTSVTLEIQLTGSKGVGLLMVEGVRTGEEWEYRRLDLVFGESRVDLLEAR